MKTIFRLWLLLIVGGLLVPLCYFSLLRAPPPIKVMSKTREYNTHSDRLESTTFTTETKNSPQFVYCIQGATMHAIQGLSATPDRDIIWLTYKDRSGDIYFPNSTIAMGRNKLLTEAIDRAAKWDDGGYLYYIFLDDDVLLLSEPDQERWWIKDLPDNPYDRLELFLLDYQPAVAYPTPRMNRPKRPATVGISYNVDANINAYHRHTISFMLPLIEDFDHVSWWFPQWFVIHTSAMFYNSYRIICHAVHVRNSRPHWKNKEKGAYPDSGNFSIARDYMRSWLIKNMTVDTINLGRVSLLQTFQKSPMYFYIKGSATRKGDMEYRVSTKFITTVFNTSHPAVRRILQWRNQPQVKKILYGEDEDEPEFVPDVFPLH